MFEVEGFSIEINKNELSKFASSRDIGLALLALGQIGENSAKENAPVRTGHLRRSITHVLVNGGTKNQFVRVGTNVEYAIFQEFGTRFHAAHPFFRPAMSDIERALRSGG